MVVTREEADHHQISLIIFTADDLVRGLYTVDTPKSGLNLTLNEVSFGDNLYEGPAKDDILEFVKKKTAESFIPTFSKIQGNLMVICLLLCHHHIS